MGTSLGEPSAPTVTASTGITEPTGHASGYTDRRTTKALLIPVPLSKSCLGFSTFFEAIKTNSGGGRRASFFPGNADLGVCYGCSDYKGCRYVSRNLRSRRE